MALVVDPQSIPRNAVAPYALTYVLRSTRFNLMLVTAARFVFRRAAGKGVQGSWAAARSSTSLRSLTLTYAFQAGDLPDVDDIVFEPRVVFASLGAGEVVGATRTLYVVEHPALER